MRSVYEKAIGTALSLYKTIVSPLFGSRCRFLPSCSSYAAAVLVSHGPVAGSALAIRRLCRCHPLGGSGYDPPPARIARAAAWKCDA